ncbi:MAG: hypothetical protein KDD35_11830 [Bdellovibrionales bacterium]|nr:hypothetical protein [Bdellovibrionales bacterium]
MHHFQFFVALVLSIFVFKDKAAWSLDLNSLYAPLYSPKIVKESPIALQICRLNTLVDKKSTNPQDLIQVCLSSPMEDFNEAIHDYQIFNIKYRDGSILEFPLLPFKYEAQLSYELNRFVIKGRLMNKSQSMGSGSFREGAVFLVYENSRDEHTRNLPLIVGSTPLGEAFLADR